MVAQSPVRVTAIHGRMPTAMTSGAWSMPPSSSVSRSRKESPGCESGGSFAIGFRTGTTFSGTGCAAGCAIGTAFGTSAATGIAAAAGSGGGTSTVECGFATGGAGITGSVG